MLLDEDGNFPTLISIYSKVVTQLVYPFYPRFRQSAQFLLYITECAKNIRSFFPFFDIFHPSFPHKKPHIFPEKEVIHQVIHIIHIFLHTHCQNIKDINQTLVLYNCSNLPTYRSILSL